MRGDAKNGRAARAVPDRRHVAGMNLWWTDSGGLVIDLFPVAGGTPHRDDAAAGLVLDVHLASTLHHLLGIVLGPEPSARRDEPGRTEP